MTELPHGEDRRGQRVVQEAGAERLADLGHRGPGVPRVEGEDHVTAAVLEGDTDGQGGGRRRLEGGACPVGVRSGHVAVVDRVGFVPATSASGMCLYAAKTSVMATRVRWEMKRFSAAAIGIVVVVLEVEVVEVDVVDVLDVEEVVVVEGEPVPHAERSSPAAATAPSAIKRGRGARAPAARHRATSRLACLTIAPAARCGSSSRCRSRDRKSTRVHLARSVTPRRGGRPLQDR